MDLKLGNEVGTQDSGDTTGNPPTSISRKQLRRYEVGYFLSTFAIGPPFASFGTYVGFQLQNIGYIVGNAPGEAPRSGCLPTATSCRVPFAGSGDVNLTSYVLYLNAIIYALSGGLTLIISGIGDYLDYQREQYVVQLIIYGILCLPIASLRGNDLMTFNTLSGLYVFFNVIGFIAGAWMNIFIPFVMHKSEGSESLSSQQPSNNDEGLARKAIEDGMKMGVWGSNGLSAGQIVLYVISIGLTFVSAAYAGLYTTTAAGVLCIIISLIAWRLLPAPKPKSSQKEKTAREWLMLPLATFSLLFRQVWEYPESFKYLLAYTVYTDTLFAFGSVTSQLFNLNIRPSLREFTYYSLVQPSAAIISATVFLYVRPTMRNAFGITLRHWTIVCYALTCFCALWCAIGISPSVSIGFKHRWEFYFFQALQSIAASIAGVAFKVLFSRLFPPGNEIQFFGFQLVLSLGTVWIPQIVNGPIVDATNNLRLPAAISSALLLFCVVITLTVDESKGMRQAGYEGTGD
ncbi:autophagy-related protein 22-like protein [Xylaria flabelliformis]|nr:autophagy-related protein 22-like protein [Xylaria flabelliformis]